jgi:Protein of unknown function (DUF3054)
MISDGNRHATVAPWIAIGIDAICLALFVLLGRESHGLDSGVGWYLTVLWPFITGWFVAAAVTRTYSGEVRWDRAALSLLLGVALALLLRVTLTHRSAPPAFVIVAYVFNAITLLGWRVALTAWSRVKRA